MPDVDAGFHEFKFKFKDRQQGHVNVDVADVAHAQTWSLNDLQAFRWLWSWQLQLVPMQNPPRKQLKILPYPTKGLVRQDANSRMPC